MDSCYTVYHGLICINMKSGSGHIDRTLGLVQNIVFRMGHLDIAVTDHFSWLCDPLGHSSHIWLFPIIPMYKPPYWLGQVYLGVNKFSPVKPSFTIALQVHVLDTFTSSKIDNLNDGNTVITLMDPN